MNYCMIRWELLAGVECIKHFREYLNVQRFQLKTVYASLRWLLQFKHPEEKNTRSIDNFEIEHRKGEQRRNSRALPRLPWPIECKYCSEVERSEWKIDIRLMQLEVDGEWEPCVKRRNQLNNADLERNMGLRDAETTPFKTEMAKESPVARGYWVQ